MPELKNRPPSYRLHKASGRAIVTIHGRDHYLGKYGSPESHQKYQQHVAQWAAAREQPTVCAGQQEPARDDLRVCELLVA